MNAILAISKETDFVVDKISKKFAPLTNNSRGKAIVGNDDS